MNSYFAVTTPGLEKITAQELLRLGLFDSLPAEAEEGGLTFTGGLEALYRANLSLRSANRVVARLGQWFYARDFAELRQRAARLPWERFLVPGRGLRLRVTCHQSKLYHSGAVAERVALAIADRLGKDSPWHTGAAEDEDHPEQLILVRLENDRATVSVDSSGELLHRRGYRLASAKAPLRENLAAALLLASGWDGASPLIDPFCGSGTFPIEAALMALGLPPGANRKFAFMDWPGFDSALWNSVLRQAAAPPRELPPLFGFDRDAGAVRLAGENAARAGALPFITFGAQAVSHLQGLPALPPGWLITNPPYGVRLSDGKDLRNLYAQFGNVLRDGFRGWRVGVLTADLSLLGQMKLNFDTSLRFKNGGLPVIFGRAAVA